MRSCKGNSRRIALPRHLEIMAASGLLETRATLVNWNVFISADAVLLAVVSSVGVGLFFGIWPARRAAKLDPIEALRHD